MTNRTEATKTALRIQKKRESAKIKSKNQTKQNKIYPGIYQKH